MTVLVSREWAIMAGRVCIAMGMKRAVRQTSLLARLVWSEGGWRVDEGYVHDGTQLRVSSRTLEEFSKT
jgi:hypothetical protein